METWCGKSGKLPTPATMERYWQHHVAMFDGQFLRYYLGGVKYGEIEKVIDTKPGPLMLGVPTVDWVEGIDGELDDVAIFNRALTDDEVLQLYRIGIEGTLLK